MQTFGITIRKGDFGGRAGLFSSAPAVSRPAKNHAMLPAAIAGAVMVLTITGIGAWMSIPGVVIFPVAVLALGLIFAPAK